MAAPPESQPHSDHENSLLKGFARSVRDNAVGEVAVQLTRVAGVIYLARRLEPSDFGLFRMLLVVSTLVSLTIEAGIPEALIQRKQLGPEHEATGWWISCTIGVALAAMLYECAPLISGLLAMPGLIGQLRLLCLPMLLLSAATTASARLRRNFKFGAIALADSLAEVGFLAAAIILLVGFHAPRWALAGGLAMRLLVQGLVVVIASPYLPSQLPSLRTARELFRFAFSVWSGRMLVTFSFNADFVLIGRILGSTMLGYYGIAWDLLRFIPDRMFKVIGRVTLPLFAQLQDDDAALRRRYGDLVRETARMLLPAMTGLAIAAPEVVRTVYGAQWNPAAAPLRALSIGITLIGITIGIGPIYYAKGRPVLDLYLHSMRLVLIVAVVSLTAFYGLLPASIGMTTVESTIVIVGQLMVNSAIALPMREFMRALRPGIRNSVVSAIATELGRLIAAAAGLHGVAELAVIIGLPALGMAWLELGTLMALAKGSLGGGLMQEAPSEIQAP
jgi:O-antigen/teichoic acid export membrane protein